MRYTLYRWYWTALDWLFPPVCGGCESPGSRWCPNCQQQIHKIEPPVCDRCGDNVHQTGMCSRCERMPPSFTAIRSWAAFDGPVRNAIHRIKYRHDIALADMLSTSMISYLEELDWQIDLVLPVPLGKDRIRERGYNQAALLAKPIAWGSNLPYRPRALRRARETRSQVGLSLKQRHQNVRGAFECSREIVEGKSVLVVDDVATSGATLDACAEALWSAGAAVVYGFTLARAMLDSN